MLYLPKLKPETKNPTLTPKPYTSDFNPQPHPLPEHQTPNLELQASNPKQPTQPFNPIPQIWNCGTYLPNFPFVPLLPAPNWFCQFYLC